MIPLPLQAWAIRWRIPAEALRDLALMLGQELPAPLVIPARHLTGEADVQAVVRLEAAAKGVRLHRNNVGVLEDRTGRPVRFGLANDSAALNARLKSSDLIGWRPVTIEPHHVGTVIAQFTARECKHPGWTYTGTPREEAQLRWLHLVLADGGDAAFAAGEGTL